MASLSNLARTSSGVKKLDMFNVPLDLLQVEKGFNPRDLNTKESKDHIRSIAQSILDGAKMPPLEVRVNDDGVVLIVDGHCRREAYLLAREQGAEIELVGCIPFQGNDVERVAKTCLSAQGLPLTALETADAYARLIAFGWTEEKIAQRTGKTPTHVHNLLVLAGANSDVRKLVKSGKVSVTEAIGTILKKGEKAGEHLQGQIDKAEAKEAAKVNGTPREVKTKSPKRIFVDGALDLMGRLDAVYGDRVLAAKSDAEEYTVTAGELRAVISAYRAAYVVQPEQKA